MPGAATAPAPPATVRAAALGGAVAVMAIEWVLSGRTDPNPTAGVLALVTSQLAHLVVFGTLAVLWWLALGRRYALVAAALAVAYGVVDELHQAGTPGRDATPVDVAFDAAGAAIALTLARRRIRRA